MKLSDCVFLLLALPVWAQTPAPTSTPDYVQRVTERVRIMLSKLPNYTCVMRIDRKLRLQGEKKFHSLDPARLEVAYLDQDELYAWPGSPRFEQKNLADMVGNQGAIGTGDFGLHLHATYLSSIPIVFAGEEALHKKPMWKFTQHVPRAVSGYIIGVAPRSATAGYDVTAWHDPKTYELERYELVATDVPKELRLKRAFKAVEYQDVDVAGTKFRLPARTEMWMVTDNGEARTVTTFTKCHQYAGESTLLFPEDDNVPDAKPAPAAKPVVMASVLPPNVKLETKIADDFDFSKLAKGDQFTLPVSRDITVHGKLIVQAGAKITLRVSNARCEDDPYLICYAIFEPDTLTVGGVSLPFRARLDSPGLGLQVLNARRRLGPDREVPLLDQIQTVEEGTPILIQTLSGKLPRGTTLTWRTLEIRGESAP